MRVVLGWENMAVYFWSQLVDGLGSEWREELVKNMFRVL